MRKLIGILALTVAVGGFAALPEAEAHHDSKYKYKYKFKNKFGSKHKHRSHHSHGVHRYGWGDVNIQIGAYPAFTYHYEQVWVDPVYERRVVGYDACGRPIRQSVLVAPGCYKTAKFKVYRTGGREFICYV